MLDVARLIIGASSMAWLMGCTGPQAAQIPADQFGPDQPVTSAGPIQQGYWQSDGYGFLLALEDTALRAFDLTETTCIETDLDGVQLADFYDWVRISADQQVAQVWTTVEPHPTQYRRIESLPHQCDSEIERPTPRDVFDHFAAYMGEHYAFFDLYDIDWSERVQAGRARITPSLSDEELFEVLVESLDGIEDAHVDLEASIDGQARRFSPGDGNTPLYVARHNQLTGAPLDNAASFFNGYWLTNIRDDILGGDGGASENRRLQYGMASDRVGYVALLSVGVFAQGQAIDAMNNRIAFNTEMDRAISQLQDAGAEAIILDLSVNFGGFDYIAREAIRFFAQTPTFVFSKQALDTDNRMAPTRFVIEPTAQAFTGPVYIITSDATVSGGEVLTMGLRALPNTVHVGEATRGSLSDKLDKPLPNGWSISVSNEAYLDHQDRLWEGSGIPPQCALPVFDTSDPLASHRAAVATVIAWAERSELCGSADAQ